MLLRKPAGHNGRGVSTLRALPRVPAREEVLFGKFKLACTLVLALSTPSFAADAPGVTATEIKIGGVFPFSGPASSIGLVGKGVLAYVQSINERGGINGRRIN